MIKIYTMEVIGVDTEDNDRTLFTLRALDTDCAELKIETLVGKEEIEPLCAALQSAITRLELGS